MKELNLIGLGTGSENLLTDEAKSALYGAQVIFGAKRLLAVVEKLNLPQKNVRMEPLYAAGEIFAFLEENPQFDNVSVVFSGDLGFFSGAKSFYELSEKFCGWQVKTLPGISSAVYFAAKLHKSWQNWKFLSLHGSKCNTVDQIRKNQACFFILSGAENLAFVGQKIKKAIENKILPSIKCYLGKNLSYEDEKICEISLSELVSAENFQNSAEEKSLYVLLVENEGAKYEVTGPSLCDEDFIRVEKIPMTKKEVRYLSLLSLGLSENSVLYDIGSGSGSVTVEAARIAGEGQVVAVECNDEAFELGKKNVEKFCLENVILLKGSAPDCLNKPEISQKLPNPTHVFIGGSKGNLREIIFFVLERNPCVRIVANFVSLENLCEMQEVLKLLEKENKIKEVEITQIGVSRAEKTGNFHLMKAQNPIYIVSFRGEADEV